MKLHGYPVSAGIAMGKTRILRTREIPVSHRSVEPSEVESEVGRLSKALKLTAGQLKKQKEAAKSRLSPDFLDIFDAHVAILEDPALFHGAASRIRRDQTNAESALLGSVKDMVYGLLSTGDSYFQERASDLEDLHRKVQSNLAGNQPAEQTWSGKNVIVIADMLGISQAGSLEHSQLLAFATERGGKTSHTAILARAMELPAVVGVQGLLENAHPDMEVIVDGISGTVILDPSPEEKNEYVLKSLAWSKRREMILAKAREESRTLDGHRIHLAANIDLLSEIDAGLKYGADGVGLYRSEFLFLEKAPHIPTEEEHFSCYMKLADSFFPNRVVVRTLDLGGDKFFGGVADKGEPNPVLGLRALRFCLKRKDIFKPQVRGILRASARKNIAVLFPFVTTVEELSMAKAELEEAKAELRAEGASFDEHLPVGIMVEVPSCALCAEAFALEVDFFSIGTNDLVQYLLAVDRNNEMVADLFDTMHPSVLKCISHVCASASAKKKPVAVCGEAAADSRMIPLLLGLGVTELSMTSAVLLEAKQTVRNLSYTKCHRLVRHALKASSGKEVSEMVQKFICGKKAKK